MFRNALVSCLGAVTMFAFILLAGSVVKDMLNLLAEGRLTIAAFFRLIAILFPYVFVHALPLGLLTGILLTMGRLSAQSEVTALRAAGVSVFRLSSSVIVFAIVGVAAALSVNFYYGPLAKTNYRRELANTVRQNPLGYIKEKTFVKDFPGYVIYAGEKNGDLLKDLWVWQIDDEKRAIRFARGEEGRFFFDEDTSLLTLVLNNAAMEVRDPEDPENYAQVHSPNFGRIPFQVSLEGMFGEVTFQRKLSWMTYSELRQETDFWKKAVRSGPPAGREEAVANFQKAQMVFHENFAMGFSVLSFALLGIPMGIRASRSETSANLFLAIGLALGWYVMMMAVGWMGDKSDLRPHLFYWIPNLVYQGVGCYLIFRADNGSKKLASQELIEA